MLRPLCRFFASASTSHRLSLSDSRVNEVKAFVSRFSVAAIPADRLETQFSRSSGAGGQNVNKVATKVDMRFKVQDADWIPEPVKENLIREQAARMNKRGLLIMTSERHRTQAQNIQDCIEKLHVVIRDAAVAIIPLEPDAEKAERINELKAYDKERSMKEKQHRSNAKSQRKAGRNDY
ncbi:Peptidyl-tRNA hydrolase ict1, mitochondrial [Chytriomyces hyalinus]|nr:Peptidyl-tRNA hydrolase ict1, mitochondrial [Chytriomyces hyalinus]